MSYVHFSAIERAKIEVWAKQGRSHTAIAHELGRHRTSVGREVRRNRGPGGYEASTAQTWYHKRRQVCRPRRRLDYGPLREFVGEQIAVNGWSPELAAGCLPRLYPHAPRMRACHETIYRTIYTAGHFLDYLCEYLPQARPKRRRRGQGKTRRGPNIPNRISIAERPAAVEQRLEAGHWEGDLIVGKQQDGFILTLVERKARLLHAVKLNTRHAADVCHAVVRTLLDRPISWVKSITFDNGSEFAGHHTLTALLGVAVYFADPYSAYQRGSNEQVNGLIRRYLPKGTSFKSLPEFKLQQIVELINNRPRKCLGYQTPNDVFNVQRQSHLRALRA